MSDEVVTLDLLGRRTLAMQADIRDLKTRMTSMEVRFSAIEARFAALEGRIDGVEQRLTGTMDLLVRIAKVMALGYDAAFQYRPSGPHISSEERSRTSEQYCELSGSY